MSVNADLSIWSCTSILVLAFCLALWLGSKRKEDKETEVSYSPLKSHPNDLIPSTGPHLFNVLPPPRSNNLGIKPLTHRPWGTFQIQMTAVPPEVVPPSIHSYIVFGYVGETTDCQTFM
jgi:hypothetical protein